MEKVITALVEDAQEFNLNMLDKKQLEEMLFKVGHELMQDPCLNKIHRDNKGNYFDKRFEDINFVEGAVFGLITILRHRNIPALLTDKRENYALLLIIQKLLESQGMGGGFAA